MRPSMLIATIGALSFAPISATRAADCDTLLHLHGYLTVATVRCGFTEAPNIIDAASTCRSQVGKASATKTATDGIRFAQGEMVAKGGISPWCSFVRGQYPSLVSGKAR
ncbi:hypothetical protein SAMN05519104_2459 [Rhizobiales bacterium GAS188]|nr:hypothetical protein SAMN05519104_2459 [Rhizobiales bacterium GAS188]